MSFSRDGAVLNNTSNVEYKNALIKRQKEKERMKRDKKIEFYFSLVQNLKNEVEILRSELNELKSKLN